MHGQAIDSQEPSAAREPERLEEAVVRALASPGLERSRVASRALRVLHERTRQGLETTQYDLAEALYGDASEADRARAAVRALRRRLADLAARQEPDEWHLAVPRGSWQIELRRREAVAPDTTRPSWQAPVPARLATALLLAAAFFGAVTGTVGRPPGEPVDLDWRGHSVVAVDESGRALWARHVGQEQGPTGRGFDGAEVIADLVGDERPEVAFITRGLNGFSSDAVTILAHDGEVVNVVPLTPEAEHVPRFGGREVAPFFHATFLRTWRPDPEGPLLLVAGAAHRSTSASTAVLLSGEGEILGRYWHVGHLSDALPWNADGEPGDEIVLAATNNDHEAAGLAILGREAFRKQRAAGCAPHRVEGREAPDRRPARDQCYLLLRPTLPRGFSLRPNGGLIRRVGDRLEADVGLEGAVFTYVFEDLDRFQLRLPEGIEDWLEGRRAAKPSVPADPSELQRQLSEQVFRWRDGRWDRQP